MRLLIDVLLFLACAGLWAVHAQVSSSGRTVVLGGQNYFVPPSPVAQFKFGVDIAVKAQFEELAQGGSVELVPFSLITTASKRFSTGQLQETVSLYQSLDDVWSPSFLQGMSFWFTSSRINELKYDRDLLVIQWLGLSYSDSINWRRH